MADTATKPEPKKGGFAAFIAAKGDKKKAGVKRAAKSKLDKSDKDRSDTLGA